MAKKIESPCVGVCQFRGQVCVACGRDKAEIKAWHGMNRKQKILVEKRARQRLRKP